MASVVPHRHTLPTDPHNRIIDSKNDNNASSGLRYEYWERYGKGIL